MATTTNTVTASADLQQEISEALETLRKNGYRANATEEPSGEVSVVFKLGENEQTLRFTKDEQQRKGAVKQKIIDKLEI